VEAHGGRVEAHSPVFKDEKGEGYGTEVAFTLPVSEATKDVKEGAQR
jgi:signal transduction histidine kinase